MKKISRLLLILFILVSLFLQAAPVFAHPADLYAHSLYVTLTDDDVSVKWEIIPGPMLVSFTWFEADTNKDDLVSAEEAKTWADARIALLTATLDNAALLLQVDDLQFPSSRDAFQSGAENITVQLSAAWPQNMRDTYKLTLHNGMEAQRSLTWYYVTALDDLQFQTPQQTNNTIKVSIYEPSAQASAEPPLRTEWDTSMPALSQEPQVALTVVPEQSESGLSAYIPNEQNTPQQILLDLVRQKEFSVSFYIFALGISLALGALHALTPGHGKTVVAAYLVGSHGTTRHAVALGTVVTLTHTGSVFLLGIITLAASQYIMPTTIIPVLEVLSGLLIVGLGLYLLWQRFQYWRRSRTPAAIQKAKPNKYSLKPKAVSAKPPTGKIKVEKLSAHSHDHGDGHVHSHDHGDGHVHSHEVPDEITWRSLIALGISGGLVPCPDAIAILLVAIAINRISLGLALIVAFSLGLAVVLIVIGLLMVNSRRLFDRMGALDRVTPVLPIVSAVVVLALGVALTAGAFVRVQGEFNVAESGPAYVQEARVLYLAGGQDQVKQLFLSNNSGDPVLLSDATNNVVEYALAPDQKSVVYIVQTEKLENKIWLVDIASGVKDNLSDCFNALCSRPIWSPDGKRVVYEYTKLSGDNTTGLATLRWIDIATGESQAVFQESNLPGTNPRWSPDGRWLSFTTPEKVWIYNLETGDNHVIKSTLAAAADWSPDSQAVLYRDIVLQERQFITQLFVYDLASRTTTNINPDMSYENLSAAWSPDGEWIAVIRRDLSVPLGDQVWLMRANGSEARTLTDDPGKVHNNLKWSPDGKYLLYDVYSPDSATLESDLMTIAIETGEATSLGIQGYNAVWLDCSDCK